MTRRYTAAEYQHAQRSVEPVTVERQEQFEERAPDMRAVLVYAFCVTRADGKRAVQLKISASAARQFRGKTPGDTIEETARDMARREALHMLTEDALGISTEEERNG
jgi:hypothetical protein